MYKMNWDKLLSGKRETKSSSSTESFRNDFDKDYERIISTSSIRRLQDKTQVYPLQQNDFIRTRLTHSLEVSSIGRSLGKRIGANLIENKKMHEGQDVELASLLAVAGLVHDLGNPPFGHYGEDIIKKWFESNKKKCSLGNSVNDYLYFDGNAQNIRILARLQFLRDNHGVNFSFGTLGALLKYPWDSSDPRAKGKEKIGYFKTERNLIEEITSETGMKDGETIFRHPATYLLEAADDIAYIFDDLEDTVKKGYLTVDIIERELFPLIEKSPYLVSANSALDELRKYNIKNGVEENEKICNEIMTLRIHCQTICIEKVYEKFIEKYDVIMNGQYLKDHYGKNGKFIGKVPMELLDELEITSVLEKIKELNKKYAYQSKEVLKLELIGETVLATLLDKFVNAALDDKNYNNTRHESGKIFKLISPNFIYIQSFDSNGNLIKNKQLDKKQRIQIVVDFISGMTDSYALDLYNTLSGMKLP